MGNVRLQVWDTPGQERYRCIILPYCELAHVFIIVYDVTQQDLLRTTREWFDLVQNLSCKNVFIALAGNKADRVTRRRVTYEVICVCSHINGLRQA